MALAPALDLRPHPNEPGSEPSPPASIEGEQAFLGAAMYDPTKLKLLTVELLPAHFYEPFHGRLYQAISECVRDGDIPDPTLLCEEFRRDGAFLELGGVRYFADLIDRAPPAIRMPHYAAHIVDLAHRRELLRIAADIVNSVNGGGETSLDIITATNAQLGVLEASGADRQELLNAREAAQLALEQIHEEILAGKPRGPQTGLACFDTRLGGLPPQWLITVGARPSMGKTALLRSAFYGAAKLNRHDVFALYTIEMPHRELSERAISAASWGTFDEVQTQALNRSTVKSEDLARLVAIADTLPTNLLLDDRADLGLEEVRRSVWQIKAKHPLRAIGIDYLQLMRRGTTRGKTDAALIGEITAGLKLLAREANICIVLASQLTRGVDSREDKKPQLSDLRESGSIEQDSNAVIFPFREAYYLERSLPDKSDPGYREAEDKLEMVKRRMDVHVAKNRQGGLGFTRQRYIAEHDFIEDTD